MIKYAFKTCLADGMEHYDYSEEYASGKMMHTADCFSR